MYPVFTRYCVQMHHCIFDENAMEIVSLTLACLIVLIFEAVNIPHSTLTSVFTTWLHCMDIFILHFTEIRVHPCVLLTGVSCKFHILTMGEEFCKLCTSC